MAETDGAQGVLDTPGEQDTQGAQGKDTGKASAREDAIIADLKKGAGQTATGDDDASDDDAGKKGGIEDVDDDADPQLKRMRDDYLSKNSKLAKEREELEAEREAIAAEKAEIEKIKAEAGKSKTQEDGADKGSKKQSDYFDGFHNPDPDTISGEYEGEQELHKAILSLARHNTALEERLAKFEEVAAKLPEIEGTVGRLNQAEVSVAAQSIVDSVKQAAILASKDLGIEVTPEQVMQAVDKYALSLFNPETEEFTANIALDAFDIAYKRDQRALAAAKSQGNGAATNGHVKKSPPDMGSDSLTGSDKDPVDREEKVIRDLQRARAGKGRT